MQYMVDDDLEPRDAEDVTVALKGGPSGLAQITFGFTEKSGGNVLVTGGIAGTIMFQEALSMSEFIEAIVNRPQPDQVQ